MKSSRHSLVAIFAASHTTTTRLTSAFADCHDSLQRSGQERKLLAQVRALKVKHFHLCNKIAGASRGSSTQLSRTVKDLEEHKMVDGRATDTPA